MVYVPVVTALFPNPEATAIALMVVGATSVTGEVYLGELAVGVVPSVV